MSRRPHQPRDNERANRHVTDLADRTTVEIGLAWQISTVLLDKITDPAERCRLVVARQEYLDELYGRDPEGTARWADEVMSGRPALPPHRYISAPG